MNENKPSTKELPDLDLLITRLGKNEAHMLSLIHSLGGGNPIDKESDYQYFFRLGGIVGRYQIYPAIKNLKDVELLITDDYGITIAVNYEKLNQIVWNGKKLFRGI